MFTSVLLLLCTAATAGDSIHVVVSDEPKTIVLRVSATHPTVVTLSEPLFGPALCDSCSPLSADGVLRVDTSADRKKVTIRVIHASANAPDYASLIILPLTTSTLTITAVPIYVGQAEDLVAIDVKRRPRDQGTDELLRELARRPKGPLLDEARCMKLSEVGTAGPSFVAIQPEELCRYGRRFYVRATLSRSTFTARSPFVNGFSIQILTSSGFAAVTGTEQWIDAWQPAGEASAVVSWPAESAQTPLLLALTAIGEGSRRSASVVVAVNDGLVTASRGKSESR